MSFYTDSVTLNVGRWTLTGLSLGGTHTTIVMNELKICFDIGVLTNESTHCDKVLISHGHVDHCQSFFKHYRCRKIRKMYPTPVYIVPPVMETPMKESARSQFNMEKGRSYGGVPKDFIEIKSLHPNEHHEFNRCSHSVCKIYAYPMTHRIPAFGYTVVSEVPKLREEYYGIPGHKIKELRETKDDLFYTKRVIEVAYTGDTTIEGVLRQSDFLTAEILIIECTIIDDQLDRNETTKRGHIHIQDIVDNYNLFTNKHIVLFHLSPRYTGNVFELVDAAFSGLPKDFTDRVQILWPKKSV